MTTAMQIEANVRAYSVNTRTQTPLISFEFIYPRFIHSELMTHRLFSRNAASSRAIPTPRQIEMIREDPAKPVEWGKNQRGMQAEEQVDNNTLVEIPIGEGTHFVPIEQAWEAASCLMADFAQGFYQAGVHKQQTNRLIEPFVWMRTIVTASEWDNWFWLRCDEGADPTIKRLAELSYQQFQQWDGPNQLDARHLHVPFYNESGLWEPATTDPFGVSYDQYGYTAGQALMISSSCCAQISFRREDNSFEKAQSIYSKLIESEPVHASPFEHQAWVPPREVTNSPGGASAIETGDWVQQVFRTPGVTHISKSPKTDRQFDVWSGNFRNWIQHRQVLDNHTCWNYDNAYS